MRELIAAPAWRIQQRNAAMRSLSWLLACAGLAAIIAGPASAQNPPVPLIDRPTYLMTYLEVIPSTNARAIASRAGKRSMATMRVYPIMRALIR